MRSWPMVALIFVCAVCGNSAAAPSVDITSTAPDPTYMNPIPVTATFSEPVNGFTDVPQGFFPGVAFADATG